jgi:hypothetical protein
VPDLGTARDDTGYIQTATVTGLVFVDTDGNGFRDAGEPPLAGVSVVITDDNGTVQTVTTDGSGLYTATVAPGNTTADIVESTLPVGYVHTTGLDPNSVNASAGAVTSIGEDGYQPQGQVTGVVYFDVDQSDPQMPPGATLTTGNTDPTTVNVPDLGTARDDTGYIQTATVTGLVFVDTDGDGFRDAGVEILLGRDGVGACR